MTPSDVRPAASVKERLRRERLAARDALPTPVRAEASLAIADRAAVHLRGHIAGRIVAGYWPIRSEADPRPLMAALERHGARLALPVVAHPTLRFRAYHTGDALIAAGFGTFGPPEGAEEVAPDLLLMPCAAFDRSGNRIGYGAGHYDRAIAALRVERHGRPPDLVALAFSVQEVAHVPAEPHDRILDAIVTEREWVAPA